MTESAQHFISELRALPEVDRQEVVAALLREALSSDYPSPDEAALLLAADTIFLDLDRRESE